MIQFGTIRIKLYVDCLTLGSESGDDQVQFMVASLGELSRFYQQVICNLATLGTDRHKFCVNHQVSFVFVLRGRKTLSSHFQVVPS